MKKIFILGRILSCIGAIIGGASVIGIIGFSGGYVENGSQLAGWLLLLSFVCLGILVVIVNKLPEFLRKIEAEARDVAADAKIRREKKRYIRYRRIADMAGSFRMGLFND